MSLQKELELAQQRREELMAMDLDHSSPVNVGGRIVELTMLHRDIRLAKAWLKAVKHG